MGRIGIQPAVIVTAIASVAHACGGAGLSSASDPTLATDGGPADSSADAGHSTGEASDAGADATTDGALETTGGAPPPPPPSDNPIDVAIWPRMVAGGHTEIPTDPPEVLCRRMALDFMGRVPSDADIGAHCFGNDAEAMARSFMTTPEFIARQRKLWIQHLGPIPEQVFGEHILELDGIIDALAAGTLGYDAFAIRVSAHPAFVINRAIANPEPYEDSARALTRVFLGRAPHGTELETLGRLFRIWRRDWLSRGTLGYSYYVRVATIDPDACEDPVVGDLLCTAELWGEEISIELPIADEVLYESIAGAVPPELQAALEVIGTHVVRQPEFWGEAADHALAQLLGWWKSTPAQNETDVAEVRTALAAWFASTEAHDVRDLYATIASSILYTRTAELSGDVDDVPPWAIGPTKAMDATQFLDSLEVIFDRELGFCDIHTPEAVNATQFWPAYLRVPQDPSYYGFGYDFYRTNAVPLGGCVGAIPEPTQPGLESLFTHIDLANALCPGAPPVPNGFDPVDVGEANIEALVDHAYHRFLTRAPLPGEIEAIDTAREACAGDDTCAGQIFAEQLCGALMRSGAFLFY